MVLAQNANLALFTRGAGAKFSPYVSEPPVARGSHQRLVFSSTHYEEVIFSLLSWLCLIIKSSPSASIACCRRVLYSISFSSFNLPLLINGLSNDPDSNPPLILSHPGRFLSVCDSSHIHKSALSGTLVYVSVPHILFSADLNLLVTR